MASVERAGSLARSQGLFTCHGSLAAMATDPHEAANAVLSRLRIAVTSSKPRIVRAVFEGGDTAGAPAAAASSAADRVSRPPVVVPSTAGPCGKAEVRALCEHFGISVGFDTAGGHAILREARRVCEQVHTAPISGGLEPEPSARAPLAAAARRAGDDPVVVRKSHWLSGVTIVPAVEPWVHAQRAALGRAELSSAVLAVAMGAASASAAQLVRDSGAVAAAVGGEMSEPACAACYLLQCSRAYELRCGPHRSSAPHPKP